MSEEKIKCVVWDLDNTIWEGTLIEGGATKLTDGIVDVIKALDERGILQSVASKNNYDDAYKKLCEFGINEYFLYPQINWNPKSNSINEIAKKLNIGINTLAFVDDQPFEREEVSHLCPSVMTIDALDIKNILSYERMTPRFITEDTKNRRKMYIAASKRDEVEKEFVGTSAEFLQSLDMELTIAPVSEEDLQRAYELTIRTHQLNSTGYTYSYDELKGFIEDDKHIFLIAGLKDKFGDYGKIGLILVENDEDLRIKLLLMSCRVMSRGVGSAILVHLAKLKEKLNKRMFAEFKTTDRNRMMYITYKLMGFEELEDNDGDVLLEYTSEEEKEYPPYFKVIE